MSWAGVGQRRVATNGIELNVAEAGEGPLVVLLHGFPVSWYSWRHQFKPLADAGYHVVAPDMRGYGKSDKPQAIEAYNQVEADIRNALKKFLVMAGGETDLAAPPAKKPDDDMLSDLLSPDTLPPWLSEADLDFYAAEFKRNGMRGPLNYYRNHDLTWELTKDAPTTIEQPAFFIAGACYGVLMMSTEALKAMPLFVKDVRSNSLISGVGHWTQQEAPGAVNETILAFSADVDR